MTTNEKPKVPTFKTSELPNIENVENMLEAYGENYVQPDIKPEEFETEEWAQVPNEFLTPEAYNSYFISSLGRVYCSGFTYMTKTGKKTYPVRFNKIRINKKNYYTTGVGRIFINNRRTILPVHQLIMMAFDEHIPNGNIDVVDHQDHNSLNNRFSNLKVISHLDNINKDYVGETPYRGVCINKNNKIYSQINLNGIDTIKLGYYPTLKQAAFAYPVAREFRAVHPGKHLNKRFIKFIKDIVDQIVVHFGDDFESQSFDEYLIYPYKKFDFSVITPDFTILTGGHPTLDELEDDLFGDT